MAQVRGISLPAGGAQLRVDQFARVAFAELQLARGGVGGRNETCDRIRRCGLGLQLQRFQPFAQLDSQQRIDPDVGQAHMRGRCLARANDRRHCRLQMADEQVALCFVLVN